MISGTHSHSGPAGFFQFLLFEVTSLGHVDDTTQAFVDGITKSILEGYFLNVNISNTFVVTLFVFTSNILSKCFKKSIFYKLEKVKHFN